MLASSPKMNVQKTIQITNAIQLSVAYLKRFFQNVGPIQQVIKDQVNNIVYIEFKNRLSIQKALGFNNRVLDKKPITIKLYHTQIKHLKHQQQQHFQKIIHQNTKPQRIEITSTIKLPCLHEFKPQQCSKLPIRSEYRLIDHSDIQQYQLHFRNNPLQGIHTKGQLWKIILNDLSPHIDEPDPTQRELILSAALGIWALIQLKLQQIKFLLQNNENKKSKYIESFIQEIVINKFNTIKNPNLITNSNKFKTITIQHTIEFPFCVIYPQQPQQEEKFSCEANQKIHTILCILYHFSPLIGKIYHELHTNSLILYENRDVLQQTLQKFFDLPSKNSINNMSKMQEESQVDKKLQNQIQVPELNIDENMKFFGFIQNYGSFFFQNLTPYQAVNHYNSVIWLQTKNNKIQGPYPYPGFFSCNLLFNGCKDKSLHQLSFFNLYKVENQTLQKKESHSFEQYVMIFQDGQFTLNESIENTLSFMRFELRNLFYKKQKAKQENKIQQTEKPSIDISMNLDIFYVGINIKLLEKHIFLTYNKLIKGTQNLAKKFSQDYRISLPKLVVNFSFIEILPQKQKQFNIFKCENYLINHIDKHFLAKNSIIASEEFAQKVAQKIIQQSTGNELFGFKDKKYLGSEIWRLYNKSGARRAKLKISHYNFKKLKLQ